MAEQVEKCIVNNMCSENSPNVKEECKDDDFVDDKVLVCETAIIIDNAGLQSHVKNNIIQKGEMLTDFDDFKTELSLSEEQNNTINYNVKIEEGISADNIKIEFDNGLLFCEDCRVFCQGYCTECAMLVHILNKEVSNSTDIRTQDELPNDFLEIQYSFGRFAIFALRVIPKDVQFGPFTGLSTLESDWKLKEGKFVVSEDKLKSLNWMQHVNFARTSHKQNLLAFQYKGDLYYQSIRKIEAGEELLVYFGAEYQESWNGNVEMDFIPDTGNDVKDVFACIFCCLGFSSSANLAKHKSICLNNTDGKFSLEDITQCPFCNICLGEKEYYEYHMAYCCEKNIRKGAPPIQDNQKAEVKCDGSVNVEAEQTRQDLRGECKRNGKRKYKICRKAGSSFACADCDYETGNKENLTRHVRTHHLRDFKYRCETCEYKTNNKAHFDIHTMAVHLKEFKFTCEVCDYRTNWKSNLEVHVKTKHLKEFNYACEMCDYKTNRKLDLRCHVRAVHLREFNYKCEVCDYKTNWKSHLGRHTKTKHLK